MTDRRGGFLADVDVEDEVEVEVEVEVLDVVVEELVLVEWEGGELLAVVLVLAGAGAHDSLSETTTPTIGRLRAEIGVPGGTFTLKVSVWPSSSLTVTVHASAEALGSETIANTTSIAPASASILHSFRLSNNVALLLQISPVRAGQSDAPHV